MDLTRTRTQPPPGSRVPHLSAQAREAFAAGCGGL